MADRSIPLFTMFRNPALRAAFERADRDNGSCVTVPVPRNPNLIGSAGASLKWRLQLETSVA